MLKIYLYNHTIIIRLEIKNKAPVVLCELLFNDKMFKEKQINK